MKIGNKIVLTFGMVFVATMLILGMVVGFFSSQTFHAQVENNLEAIVLLKAEQVRTLVNSQKEFVSGLAASLGLKDYLKATPGSVEYKALEARERGRLLETQAMSSGVLEFEILNSNGTVILSTGKTLVGADKSMDPYFVNGKTGPYLKDLYFSEVYKQLMYTVSAPVVDSVSRETLGVVVTRYNPIGYFELMKGRFGLGETGETFLVNRDKYLMTPSKYLGEDAVLTRKLDTQNVADCFGGDTTIHVRQYVDYRGVSILGTHVYIPETGWCLIGKIDAKEVLAPSVTQGYIFGIFTIVATIVFFVLGWVISQSISRPIEELQKGMEIVGGGNLDYVVGTKRRDEIGNLSWSFDRMIGMVKNSRAEINTRVAVQTEEIRLKNKSLEERQMAIINVAEDAEKAREIIAREKKKIDAILHSIGDGVFVVDKDLKVILINEVAAKMSGFAIEEILGEKYTDKLKFVFEKTEKINDQFIAKAIETKVVQEMSNHTILVSKSGDKISVSDSAAPLMDDTGAVIGCVVVFRDVTKERNIDRMKTELVSLVTHQLRTPITSVKWTLETLMAGDGGELNLDQKKILQNAIESNDHMNDLVGALLNISRMESGRIMIVPEMTIATELVKSVLSELLVQTQEKNIKMELSSSYDTPINIDPKLIRGVYKNLLTNAVKYSNMDGVIRIDISRLGDELVSRVSDFGFGIPKGEQGHIFQKFYRASNITEKVPDGTGLGLYLTKQIVDASGGKIGFESEENKGTTFWFSLPISGMVQKVGEVSIG